MKNNIFEYKQIVNSLTDEWDEMNSSLYYRWSKDKSQQVKLLWSDIREGCAFVILWGLQRLFCSL